MKVLILASDKQGHFAPFIEEQMTALQACGVEIIRYGVTGKGIVGYLRELPALRRMIRAERPDIIHAHYGLCGLLANLQRLVPVVTTYHGCDINAKKNRPFSKIAMYLSAWNIFVSHRQLLNAFGTKKRVKENEKWSLMPCGVNIDTFYDSHHNHEWFISQFPTKKYVLFAGSFKDSVKDSALAKQAIEVYNQLHSEQPVELLELRGYSRDEVVILMNQCNTLLLTSIREGSPQVVKEAMACGCPIVSVDVGDVAERVKDVEGCYVILSRNPKELAKALEYSICYGRTKGRDKLLEDGLDNAQIAKKIVEIYMNIKK